MAEHNRTVTRRQRLHQERPDRRGSPAVEVAAADEPGVTAELLSQVDGFVDCHIDELKKIVRVNFTRTHRFERLQRTIRVLGLIQKASPQTLWTIHIYGDQVAKASYLIGPDVWRTLDTSMAPEYLTGEYIKEPDVDVEERFSALQSKLGEISLCQSQIQSATAALNEAVMDARALGASWDAIGDAVGITQQSAHRRWSPGAKQKHAEDVRLRRERPRSEQA